MREQNYRSYILSGRSSTGDWYRVFVGPLSNKNALMDMRVEIKKIFGLEGNIVRHKIEQDADLFGG